MFKTRTTPQISLDSFSILSINSIAFIYNKEWIVDSYLQEYNEVLLDIRPYFIDPHHCYRDRNAPYYYLCNLPSMLLSIRGVINHRNRCTWPLYSTPRWFRQHYASFRWWLVRCTWPYLNALHHLWIKAVNLPRVRNELRWMYRWTWRLWLIKPPHDATPR